MPTITPIKFKRRYDYFRRKYFAGENRGNGLYVPTSKSLTWVWAPEGADILGATLFDEDNHPYEVHFNVILLRHGFDWERDRVAVHEMAHMRLGPGRSCAAKKHAPHWLKEQKRLSALGYRWL